MKKNKKKVLKHVLLSISLVVAAVFVTFGTAAVILYNSYSLDVEALTSSNNGIAVYSSNMTDSTLYNTNRSIVKIDELPDYVLKAFVDVEDKRFYKHNGYDIKRIIKAGVVNLTTNSRSQGASTISQQLVKNALLTNEKTFNRKIKEIVLSIKMEKQFSKNQILEMYLNTIYFGSNAYGIENASKIYFNKSAKDLTLNEVCVLAGLIKSPAKYSPKTNYQNAIERRNLVAKTLYDSKDITKEQYDEVINSKIELANYNGFDHSYEEEAILEACNLLNISERELINRKYQIVTYKEDDLQKKVIESSNAIIQSASDKTKTSLDGLTVVVNNNGEVVAYYANSNYNLHNLKRQPASLLKPLAVYLPCITHNILTPATKILDEKIDYSGFSPNNADNKFHGEVTVRESIANSYNVPAVKALEYVGFTKSGEILNKLGINLTKSDMNLALALGAVKNGVDLMELVNAYSTIANMGESKGYTFVKQILDSKGNTIYSSQKYSEKQLDEKDCFILTDILKDTAKTGTARRLNSLNLPIASKTGTANNGNENTDLYNVAYTTKHTIFSWIADIKDNKLPNGLYSSVEPTEINKEILAYLYKSHRPNDFICPNGVAKLPYDLTEYKATGNIIEPSSQLEAFRAYDYFKLDNPPKENKTNHELKLNAELNKSGASISFNATPDKEYELYKSVGGKETLLSNYKNVTGRIVYFDKNIFKSDEISYKLRDGGNEEIVTIKPKNYIFSEIEGEIKRNKKKWYV